MVTMAGMAEVVANKKIISIIVISKIAVYVFMDVADRLMADVLGYKQITNIMIILINRQKNNLSIPHKIKLDHHHHQ